MSDNSARSRRQQRVINGSMDRMALIQKCSAEDVEMPPEYFTDLKMAETASSNKCSTGQCPASPRKADFKGIFATLLTCATFTALVSVLIFANHDGMRAAIPNLPRIKQITDYQGISILTCFIVSEIAGALIRGVVYLDMKKATAGLFGIPTRLGFAFLTAFILTKVADIIVENNFQ